VRLVGASKELQGIRGKEAWNKGPSKITCTKDNLIIGKLELRAKS
jgi:hypothetical protein